MRSQTIAMIVVATVLLVAAAAATAATLRHRASGVDRYSSAGPYGTGLYDNPYRHYPHYAGVGALEWDAVDRRCVAYCEQEPCAVWCR